ncbi:MAG: hypothetical protein AAFY16_11320 [Cyanobacteria bacterium J06642_3]
MIGCGSNNSESENPKVEEGIDISQNPIGAIGKVIELSKDASQIPQSISQDIANKEPVTPVSFKELIDYLPQPPNGWKAAKPQGQSNSFGNYSISQVNQTYTQGSKQIEVSIFDWAFNSALYTPFLLSTEFSQESTDGYNKGLKIDDIPGREEYSYIDKRGSLNLLVNSRFFVQIDGSNIDDLELREWWQLIDSKALNQIDN